ncbi:MAG: 1-deoxy-D-xylulose-5-phosphate synthase [Thermodesulfobacteriota bacterium]
MQSATLLPLISRPQQVQDLTLQQLQQLTDELRQEIIQTVSCTGGHLAPSLGVVELTVALLKLFDPGLDKFIWDVGHQSYAYKILTRGLERFHTLRQKGGLSGFPNRQESEYDHFGVGHSSTSISAALGMAVARDLLEQKHKVLAVIGDGSMTAGLAYEGLNQAGDLDRDLVVILNDNEMSISKNVGALSSFFSRKLADQRFLRFKEDLKSWLRQVPRIGDELLNYARRSEESLKSFFTPGMLFEAFKFTYLGPINGHNLQHLLTVLEQVQGMQGPVLLHVLTTKGKGYPPAEENPTHFHGVGCFEPSTGQKTAKKEKTAPDYSSVLGQTLCTLASQEQRVLAISAAMPEGTGLARFKESYPERFFDVGICEQHAVTFAAGLASQGFKPVVCIYSTFLQRSYDQLVHDVCLQDLPVVFCLDRAGLVGEDGPTHHGAFDLSYLRHIPNMTLMAPKDEPEMQDMLAFALQQPGPVAIRYPRGPGPGQQLRSEWQGLQPGQGELLQHGTDAALLAIGSMVYPAWQAAQELEKEQGCSLAVFNSRFVKPLPEQQILELANKTRKLLFVEENALQGGFSSAVLELLAEREILEGLRLKRLGLGDRFWEHGRQNELRSLAGLNVQGIKQALLQLLA